MAFTTLFGAVFAANVFTMAFVWGFSEIAKNDKRSGAWAYYACIFPLLLCAACVYLTM